MKIIKSFFLLFLLLLSASPIQAATPKIAVFIQSVGLLPGEDDLQCLRLALVKGGWAVDYYNADFRNWGSVGISDGDWFSARYEAAIVANVDITGPGNAIGSGYGTKFQDASGVVRISESPLGGRWRIPCVVLAERVTPSTTFDDTTANNFVAGITYASPAGTFPKPIEASAGTWRYKLLYQTNKDTLYDDPENFGCVPTTWGGAGTTTAIAWAETTNGLGSCIGTDKPSAVWLFKPRGDKAGVLWITLQQSYGQTTCGGALLALQYIATNTKAKPNRIIKTTLSEHNPGVITLTAARKANYKAFLDKMKGLGLPIVLAPARADMGIGTLDSEVRSIIRDHVVNGINKWHTWSNFNFYTGADTANLRQLWNADRNCVVKPDTFNLTTGQELTSDIVSSQGLVGVAVAKVAADAGVKIMTSLISTAGSNWTLTTDGKCSFSLNPVIIPPANTDGRIIYVRPTYGLGDNSTYTGLRGTSGDAEYVGRVFSRVFSAVLLSNSLLWHSNTTMGDDPYHEWLFGDRLAAHFKYYNKIIAVDPVGASTQIWSPVP